jgi:ABC-type glycerol-3-phosphate transport system permease component
MTGRGVVIAAHILLLGLSVLVAFPVYWMIVTSLRGLGELYSAVPIPLEPTLQNYAAVWESLPLVALFRNTLVMSVLRTGGQLLTALLAAYAFVRWRFFGSKALLAVLAFTWLIPLQVTMIPNYVLLSRLGWLNSQFALVVPHIVSPFAVFLLYQGIKGFPRDLIDSAEIDGADSWKVLWRVVAPNLTATVSALAILLFITAWNDYFWPVLVTSRAEHSVIQVGLQMFFSQEGTSWGPLMAAATLTSAPIFVFYLILQRRVVDAFVRSGLH